MKLKSWWTRWAGMALATTTAAVLAGCQGQPTPQSGPGLADAERLKSNGQYEEALGVVRRYVTEHPDAGDKSDALLLAGDCEFEMKQYEEAQRDYQDAQMKPRNSQVSAKAKYGMAQSAFAGDHYGDAIKAYEAALRADNNAIPGAKTVYKLGLAYIRSGNWQEGRKKMRQVTEQYRGADEAELAAEVLALNRDAFQLKCGSFGKPEAADIQVRLLKTKGVSATTSPITRGGKKFQAVMSGNYPNFAEAKAACEKLASQGISCLVFP